jgi:hypothetical protein
MSDNQRPPFRYGTPNWEMMSRWLQLAAEDDGPFLALNLMRYRERADYADGRESSLTGREADDAYAPLGPLQAVGAVPAFLGDVVDQALGTPGWDRVGIVRYPSRAGFFEMQGREDFKELHEHKEAGMEFTIVMSCLPTAGDSHAAPSGVTEAGALVLTVMRAPGGIVQVEHPGVIPVIRFDVEGVIVGDERSWTEARFDRVDGESAHDALKRAAAGAQEAIMLTVEPTFERLLGSTQLGVDAVPVAHTPPGGYGETMPPPVLGSCTEPLVDGAPDLRGLWSVVAVAGASSHPLIGHVQRIEQCGDRLVVTGGGVVHDMRCDGTERNGVHDVAEFDYATPITVVASYEDAVHVLRPVGFPGVEVTRRLDGERMLWSYLGIDATLERV